jgi:hypothetical protein
MKKLNNHFSQFVILGVVAGAGLSAAPAQSQVLQPPVRIDGADFVLDACPENLTFLQKCDPNAGVVKKAGSAATAGLEGRVNFSPLGTPGGVILQGTGFETPDGNPLTDIDFTPPEGQNIGRMFVVEAGPGSDFQAYSDWTGTIKDLALDGVNGSPFPGDFGNGQSLPRIKDFIRVTNSVPGGGDGIVDGEQTGGFAFDAVLAEFPEYVSDGPFTTRVTIGATLQAYKLDTNGNRIEEQVGLPNNFNVLANGATGTFAATFPSEIDGVPIRELFDEASDLPLSGFGYDINIITTPDSRPYTEDTVIPEPTTILSSLLLFGGGALKLNRRKRS